MKMEMNVEINKFCSDGDDHSGELQFMIYIGKKTSTRIKVYESHWWCSDEEQ